MYKIPYIKQLNTKTCSLACLMMAIQKIKDISINEDTLLEDVYQDYGKNFNFIWNPSIALLSHKYKLNTTFYADWELLKPEKFKHAYEKWNMSSKFDPLEYESDTEEITAEEIKSLEIAYAHTFKCYEQGVNLIYSPLTVELIQSHLKDNKLITISLNVAKLYPFKSLENVNHNILLHTFDDNNIIFHDPYHGPNMSINTADFESIMPKVGAGIVWS